MMVSFQTGFGVYTVKPVLVQIMFNAPFLFELYNFLTSEFSVLPSIVERYTGRIPYNHTVLHELMCFFVLDGYCAAVLTQ